MEIIQHINHDLMAGDVFTISMVLCGLIVIFIIFKVIFNVVKALLIVTALILIAAFLMPEASILEKTQEAGKNAVEFVKDSPVLKP